jgi:hypothetical protein
MAVDDAALERLRDDLLAAISAAIRDSEYRIRGEFANAISASEARLGARMDASAAETRRHMGVVVEGLKSNVEFVAEGVVTLTERLAGELREGFESIDRRLLRVETRLLSTPERS